MRRRIGFIWKRFLRDCERKAFGRVAGRNWCQNRFWRTESNRRLTGHFFGWLENQFKPFARGFDNQRTMLASYQFAGPCDHARNLVVAVIGIMMEEKEALHIGPESKRDGILDTTTARSEEH